MADGLTWKIEVDGKAISSRINRVLTDDRVLLQAHNELARIIDPWVPFREGPLSQTLNITKDGVTYLQPYAHYQYEGEDFNHTLDYHPLASAKWLDAAMAVKKDEYARIVQNIVDRRLRELYG